MSKVRSVSGLESEIVDTSEPKLESDEKSESNLSGFGFGLFFGNATPLLGVTSFPETGVVDDAMSGAERDDSCGVVLTVGLVDLMLHVEELSLADAAIAILGKLLFNFSSIAEFMFAAAVVLVGDLMFDFIAFAGRILVVVDELPVDFKATEDAVVVAATAPVGESMVDCTAFLDEFLLTNAAEVEDNATLDLVLAPDLELEFSTFFTLTTVVFEADGDLLTRVCLGGLNVLDSIDCDSVVLVLATEGTLVSNEEEQVMIIEGTTNLCVSGECNLVEEMNFASPEITPSVA